MAANLPSPPSSRPNSPDPSNKTRHDVVEQEQEEHTSSLSKRLDDLLTSYLELLDTYTVLRAQLSKDMSSGIFALAQANRNSTLGPGRRYGEEGYDERMKASETRITPDRSSSTSSGGPNPAEQLRLPTKRLLVNEGPKVQPPFERTSPDVQEAGQHDHSTLKQDTDTSHDTLIEPPPPITPSNPIHDTSHLPSCYTYAISTSSTPAPSKDPLRWYGILVPPALRQCQNQFRSMVSSTIPELLNATSAMQSLEAQIWDVRRELGTLDEYEHGAERAEAADVKTPYENDDRDGAELSLLSLSPNPNQGQAKPRSQTPSKRASLLSPSSPARPSEPRSRILKLD
ncbi:hypothetical protein LTR99_002897 [Exophiala xenobiotica]|nr:hypothetical protein LTR41_001841 [Exophiala xenobiotica]KAK5547944.1 hypothetical protein LTR23_002193 [Chaetothyriales sp. CCFEE 6169]KAK5282034.1 hypothetical protein LTR40_003902 [Exophiala xenobiotica]KAK5305355.1 hypothetical protein LTR99_002897 [Exophiala xenobiotica]KAK5335701.1 hypothetical protein LTR98_007915 [Exophiala xenobiotica]